jgi:hypothetical protein
LLFWSRGIKVPDSIQLCSIRSRSPLPSPDMSLISCPDCAASVSDAALECPHCGRSAPSSNPAPPPEPSFYGLRGLAVERGFTPEPVPDAEVDADPIATGELHPVAIHKLLLLSVLTLGLYNVFWFYRNWVRLRERTGQRLSPFWRSFFSVLWASTLFGEVKRQARDADVRSGWSPLGLALVYLGLTSLWRLPTGWALLGYLTVLALVPVQHTINRLAAERGAKPDASFRLAHVPVFVLGGIFLLLVVIGSLMPAE